MIPMQVQTLIVANAPAPSIIVLRPVEEDDSKTGMRVVPIWIGINEATQMGIALEKTRFARPMTHDLFLDALTNLDATIDHVFIYDVSNSTFFAKLVLRQHTRLLELDARPSDALALAVRQEAPIFMDDGVFEKTALAYSFKKSPVDENEIDTFHEFIEGLAPEDFEI